MDDGELFSVSCCCEAECDGLAENIDSVLNKYSLPFKGDPLPTLSFLMCSEGTLIGDLDRELKLFTKCGCTHQKK